MRRILLLPFVAALVLVQDVALGADPQPYAVTLQPTGNDALDQALRDSSQLESLREKAPVGPFALITRARDDAARFQTALGSFGYYAAKVTVTVAGRPLDEADLPDLLRDVPAEPPVAVAVAFDPGPVFHLGRVTIEGEVPAAARDQLGLAPGAPAVAADVLAAQQRLLTAIREAGHPLAKVELPPVDLHPGEHLLDVAFRVTEGPYADIGAIQITGLKTMNEDYVRRRLLLRSGQRYSPTQLQAAREDLAGIGVFSVVRIEPGEHVDPDGTIPILIDVTERPLHSVDVGAAYSTDLGVNATVGWHHRNLFGNAEQLNLTAGVQLGGNAERRPGYNFGIQFIKPDFLVRDQALQVDLGAVKQSLDAYDQRALTQRIGLDRKLSAHWTVGVGLSGEEEDIIQEGVSRRYNLIGLPLSVKFDNTNSLLDPTEGFRATLLLTPTQSFGGSSATFTIAQLSGSAYFDLSDSGRSVVALRGLVGKAFGADLFSLPPDQRFYAGGSATVRGFRYQSVGPQFPEREGRPAAPLSAQVRWSCVSGSWNTTAWWPSSMPAR